MSPHGEMPSQRSSSQPSAAPKSTPATNSVAENDNCCADTNAVGQAKDDKKNKATAKPIEVVFLKDGERAKMAPVKIGISDGGTTEAVEGLKEGDLVITGSGGGTAPAPAATNPFGGGQRRF